MPWRSEHVRWPSGDCGEACFDHTHSQVAWDGCRHNLFSVFPVHYLRLVPSRLSPPSINTDICYLFTRCQHATSAGRSGPVQVYRPEHWRFTVVWPIAGHLQTDCCSIYTNSYYAYILSINWSTQKRCLAQKSMKCAVVPPVNHHLH